MTVHIGEQLVDPDLQLLVLHDHEQYHDHHCGATCDHHHADVHIDTMEHTGHTETDDHHEHDHSCGHLHHDHAHVEIDNLCQKGGCGHIHHQQAHEHVDDGSELEPLIINTEPEQRLLHEQLHKELEHATEAVVTPNTTQPVIAVEPTVKEAVKTESPKVKPQVTNTTKKTTTPKPVQRIVAVDQPKVKEDEPKTAAIITPLKPVDQPKVLIDQPKQLVEQAPAPPEVAVQNEPAELVTHKDIQVVANEAVNPLAETLESADKVQHGPAAETPEEPTTTIQITEQFLHVPDEQTDQYQVLPQYEPEQQKLPIDNEPLIIELQTIMTSSLEVQEIVPEIVGLLRQPLHEPAVRGALYEALQELLPKLPEAQQEQIITALRRALIENNVAPQERLWELTMAGVYHEQVVPQITTNLPNDYQTKIIRIGKAITRLYSSLKPIALTT